MLRPASVSGFLDFAPYKNLEAIHETSALVTHIFPEYQGIVMEDGSETIGSECLSRYTAAGPLIKTID